MDCSAPVPQLVGLVLLISPPTACASLLSMLCLMIHVKVSRVFDLDLGLVRLGAKLYESEKIQFIKA